VHGTADNLRLVLLQLVWACGLALFLPTDAHDLLATRVALPVLFEARAAMGRAPSLSPRLKIFSFDDTTLAKRGDPELDLPTWAQLLAAIAARHPAAIYIDKLFARGAGATGKEREAAKRLAALGTPLVSIAYVREQPLKYREPLALAGSEYQLRDYVPGVAEILRHPLPPMLPAHAWLAYGADASLLKAFRRPGHAIDSGFGMAYALIDLGQGRVLPHAALMGLGPLRIDGGALRTSVGPVPLDARGRMVVDFATPATFSAATRRLLAALEPAAAGLPVAGVEPGDHVLILPAMYTGNTDFTVTPIGPLPGAFVVASLLSSALRGEWITPFAHDGVLIFLAVLFGTLLALRGGRVAWLVVAAALAVWTAAAALLFAYGGLLVDLVTVALALLGAAAITAGHSREVVRKVSLFLHVLRSENARLKTDIEQAGLVARAFMPESLPAWPGVRIGAYHRPLNGASGDWYAFEQSPSGRYRHVVLCDIAGHGTQAALIVATCRTVWSMLLTQRLADIESPRFLAQYVRLLNGALFRNGKSWHVTTLVAVTLEPAARRLHYAACGNLPPLLLRPGLDGRYEARRLKTRYGLLGFEAELGVELEAVAFERGDELVVRSDGVDLPRSTAKAAAELSRYRKIEVSEAAYLVCQSARGTPADDQSLLWLRLAG
jgi:hypothetical protein